MSNIIINEAESAKKYLRGMSPNRNITMSQPERNIIYIEGL